MSEAAPAAPAHIRDKLAIALDVDDIVVARRLAREVQPYFGVAKVGLELYSAVGPAIVGHLIEAGFQVFLDIKLHDIPTPVGKSATVFGALGVRWLNFHAAGGEAMLRAGVEGLLAGADAVGVGTATFDDPRACWRVAGELTQWCDAHGTKAVADLIGAVQ